MRDNLIKKKLRILILTDSLGLPRSEPQVTNLEDTYPYLLKENYEIIQYSRGGATIKELFHQIPYFVSTTPDIVILQSGIVDCAPRAFSLFLERASLYSYICSVVKTLILRFISASRLRDIRNITFTNPKEYEITCKEIINSFPNSKCYAIGILPAKAEYEIKLKGITDNINTYNTILRSIFSNRYISLDDIPANGIMSDFHHLTSIGHSYVYKKILSKILENNG